ncbi:tRNA lysidine(34) synthetase [Lacrimispora xylanisolvens]|uniref:tRNA lysidine(34) synthetase n=1 Tax=Lacrimispora xylanisolvens TaxID=384636 RepID=UPI0024028B30
MYKTILDYVRRNQLFDRGDRVIVALSGGADSVCLLVVLNEMKQEFDLALKAVHVHHGLRGEEADRDSNYAGELSEKLGVPFSCAHVDAAGYAKEHGMSVEEAGRHLRYKIFLKKKDSYLMEQRLRWLITAMIRLRPYCTIYSGAPD